MSVDSPKLVLVCGMSGAGKSTLINVVTGSNLPVGHGDESETSNITMEGIPVINLNGVYVQLVDVPGFDDTRDASDTEIYLQLTTWLATRYPGDQRVSGLIYLRPISKPRVDKLEASFIGMFKALVGEEHLDHVILVTNRWNSPPDEGTEALEKKLASNEKYLGTQTGKRVRTGRFLDKFTKDEAHHILLPLRDLPYFTLQIQRETIEDQLSALEATAGQRLNDYMRGRAPELIRRAEEALKAAREAKRRLEEEKRKAEEAKARYEAEKCRLEKEVCLLEREQQLRDAGIISTTIAGGLALFGGPIFAVASKFVGQLIVEDVMVKDCSYECPAVI